MSTIEICSVCLRTDAFTPGKVQHDRDWHAGVREVNSIFFQKLGNQYKVVYADEERAALYGVAKKYSLDKI